MSLVWLWFSAICSSLSPLCHLLLIVAACKRKPALGQSICMGHMVSQPAELTEKLYTRTHCVSWSALTHKSFSFIYFSCPEEMSQRSGKVCLPSPGVAWVLSVWLRLCVCLLKPTSEHVKNSWGAWMLLVPIGMHELQTEKGVKLFWVSKTDRTATKEPYVWDYRFGMKRKVVHLKD